MSSPSVIIDMPWTPAPVVASTTSERKTSFITYYLLLVLVLLSLTALVAMVCFSAPARVYQVAITIQAPVVPAASTLSADIVRAADYHPPTQRPTTPTVVPLISDADYGNSDEGSASRPLPTPVRTVSGQSTRGTHHTTFTNVCLNFGKDDSKTLQFFNNDQDQRAQFDADYWSQNSVHWRLAHTYLDAEQSRQFPLPGSTYLPGSTFFYTLAVDNIAQFYQEAICQMPAMIDTAYQQNQSISGYDHLLALHMDITDADGSNPKREWCSAQMHMVADTMQSHQPGRALHITDHQAWHKAGRTQSFCFDEVVVYQPSACNWNAETSPYPATLKKAHVEHLDRVFEEQGLRTEVECIQNVTVYTRMDASRRRLMNGEVVAQYLRDQAVANGLKLNVRVQNEITGSIFDQMKTYNAQELHIAPHSASAYNALWLPAKGGHYVELGHHGSWSHRGIGPLMNQQISVVNHGFELLDFDPKFDNHPHEGERSFRAGPEMLDAIYEAVEGSEFGIKFCRLPVA